MSNLQQGDADGLCGLYSLLHFLSSTPEFEKETSTDILWYLLDGARHYGWLNPYTLTAGFEDYQLKSILDLQIDNYRMSYVTYFLGDVMKSKNSTGAGALLNEITQSGGSAVVSATRRNHWLLVTNIAGRPTVVDSANRENSRYEFNPKKRSFSPKWGLVIHPCSRPNLVLGF